ncbi:hypothetical protein CSIM01_09660 [Colletotrichum simmondsii]|uniref:Uncharacterized protein n=1 Tax=Colletotrichum simmondsii TaxID=703756 RepID=A0A135TSX5_9PEZI|nr:hypothetical protein CSIM01_09660 [Colletotrichum simmondsii]
MVCRSVQSPPPLDVELAQSASLTYRTERRYKEGLGTDYMRSGKSVEQPSIVHPAWILAYGLAFGLPCLLVLAAGVLLSTVRPFNLHVAEVPWETVDVAGHPEAAAMHLSAWRWPWTL